MGLAIPKIDLGEQLHEKHSYQLKSDSLDRPKRKMTDESNTKSCFFMPDSAEQMGRNSATRPCGNRNYMIRIHHKKLGGKSSLLLQPPILKKTALQPENDTQNENTIG